MLDRLVLTGSLLVGLTACSSPVGDDDDARSARVGEVIEAQLNDGIEGFPSTIVVPGRHYDLLVSSPQERIDSVSAGEAEIDDEAGDGTRFVGVTWERSRLGGGAVAFTGAGSDVSPRLLLLVDGEPTEVGGLDEGMFGWWVAVPETADEIGVAIEFDGVTQTIEDAYDRRAVAEGGPDLLYGPDPGLHDPDCAEPPAGPEPARYTLASCDIGVTDPVAYHQEMGWAPEGEAWVVVRLTVSTVVVGWDEPGTGGAVASYETPVEDVTVTLDDEEPVEILTHGPDRPAGLQDDGDWAGDAIFAVPADLRSFTVAFARPYTGLPEDPGSAAAQGAPAEITGTYGGTFEIDG